MGEIREDGCIPLHVNIVIVVQKIKAKLTLFTPRGLPQNTDVILEPQKRSIVILG